MYKRQSSSRGVAKVNTPQGEILCTAVDSLNVNDKVSLAIRPANIIVKATKNAKDNAIQGKIETMVFLGDSIDCRVESAGELIRAFVHPNQGLQRGDDVWLVAEPSDCKLLPYEAKFIEEEFAPSEVSVTATQPPAGAN